MPSDPTTQFALVIPTLNEAGNIEPLLDRIRQALDSRAIQYEVIIVDDDSRDGTAELVRSRAEKDPRIRLLVREGQRGLSGAVLCGWQHTQAELLGVMDADLQHPPEVLPSLLDEIDHGHDIAIGSRYTHEKRVRGWNPLRQAISRISTWITLPFQHKVRVNDPMSGFFIVRRRAIEGLKLEARGFKILLEILVRGRIRSAAEVPFQFGLRHAGKSKADLRVAIHYFFLLGKLSRHLIFRPGQQ